MKKILYKRNAKGEPLVWSIEDVGNKLVINHGLVDGVLHGESLLKTLVKANEFDSRVSAKRKEGYKEITELKDSSLPVEGFIQLSGKNLYNYLTAYLPKYSTTSEGFVLPMLAKTLEDNKPFDKYGNMLGQWKIDGLRCIIGLEKNDYDMFTSYKCTYHSRTGENWTNKMSWMDEIIIPRLSSDMIDLMLEEDAKLDGELYLPGHSVNDINSFVKNTTLVEHYLLQYWCYDICVENMTAGTRDVSRITWINTNVLDINNKEQHLNNKNQFVLLPTYYNISNITQAIDTRDAFISLGFEGLILRNPTTEYQFGKRNQSMFKFKRVDDGLFVIVDIIPEHKRADLPIFVCKNDINDEQFECSINLPQDTQRVMLAKKDIFIGKHLLVEFRARSGVYQVPFHARGIKVV